MAAPLHPNTNPAGASPDGAPANSLDYLAALVSSHDDITDGVTAVASFVPPLAQQLVERFGLSTASVGPTPAAQRSLHSGDRLLRLWSGPADLDDGHAFIEVLVNEFGLRPDPHFGDWPVVVEAFRGARPEGQPPARARSPVPVRPCHLRRRCHLRRAVHDEGRRQSRRPGQRGARPMIEGRRADPLRVTASRKPLTRRGR